LGGGENSCCTVTESEDNFQFDTGGLFMDMLLVVGGTWDGLRMGEGGVKGRDKCDKCVEEEEEEETCPLKCV
jgi:hypothetical protein